MVATLRELDVLVLDCQAGGATPAYGDLLEIGWAICNAGGLRAPAQAHWIVPRTDRRIPRAVRELTGWSERCVEQAVAEDVAYRALRETVASATMPTVIHFARFELTFLRDLHQRLQADQTFPFDTRCLHAIGARLFPDLPRRNIRALAGFLGHSTDLMRRSIGHVEASAFIWRALVPRLESIGVGTWSELTTWLDAAPKQTRRVGRVYPLARERRRALPDRPGVYRFLRSNGDVIYVGKAASLRKRVASHFSSGRPTHERALELLSQVNDLAVTETPSILEAALLEVDEIKRIDPPYNVQLRRGERQAWFASRDLRSALPIADPEHRIGPLPSERALISLAALIALADGAEATPALRAMALAVPTALLPDDALFSQGYALFAEEHLNPRRPASAARRVDAASRALWLARGRKEPESSEEAAPDVWDLARVRRRLERALVNSGLLMRRARLLRLLADADVAYRERSMSYNRVLIVSHGQVIERRDLGALQEIDQLPLRAPAIAQPHACFDAASYDRLRVLATELARVLGDGGEVALRFGAHSFVGERLARLLSMV